MDSISPLRQHPSQALNLSRHTAHFLRKNKAVGASKIPIPLWSSPESSELWMQYEKLMLSCLRTCDDKGAFLCLERLIRRFGATNEKVMGLRGLYQEAVAEDEAALVRILREYEAVLAEDPVNAPIAKRRIALLRTLSRHGDAIDALTELLESSPTDIEAWGELSDLYLSQGLCSQAIFCLEEVLLVAPNAWNIHARLGEALFVAANASAEGLDYNAMAESLRRFCRSIDLCDGYLRGYYGLKLTSDRLLSTIDSGAKKTPTSTGTELPIPSIETIRKLNQQATARLAEAVRRGEGAGYDKVDLVAARALLGQQAPTTNKEETRYSTIAKVDNSSTATSLLMPYNIVIDHTPTDRGDHSSPSSFNDDGDSSSDTGVHLSHSQSPQSPQSAVDSHDLNEEGSWLLYPDLIQPSDSASRPQTSNHEHPIVKAPQPEEAARRPAYRRRITHERVRKAPHPRARRSPPSTEPESVDSHEDWQGYAPGPPHHYGRQYAQYAPGYPPSHYQAYPQQSLVPVGQQQVVPYGFAPYQQAPGMPAPTYFSQGHHGGGHVVASPGSVPFSPPPGYYPYPQQGFAMPPQVPPLATYQPYPPVYSPPPIHTPPPSSETSNKDDEKFARLEKLLIDQKEEQAAKEAATEKAAKDQAAQAEAEAKTAAEIKAALDAAAAAAKEEAEKEYKAAAEKAAKDQAAQAEADAKKAADIKAALEAAAAAAKEEAEKEYKAAAEKAAREKAAQAEADARIKAAVDAAAAAAKEEVEKEYKAAAEKAAKDKAAQAEAEAKMAAEIKAASDAAAAAAKEEVEKEHKAAAEKAAADAAAEAAAATPAPAPPKEKDKPIKFKDAVGRKFNFPFHLCATWSGMEFLIKEAFVHVEGIGPHVAAGHYDLLGPQGEIILPHVWETVIEPDWTVTMHMWPMPEEKEEEPTADAVADTDAVEGLPPPPPPAPGGVAGNEKGKKKKAQPPPGFMFWTAGKKTKKGAKIKKK
ncbi:MAG: hypothetical protein Q9217_000316 [Psora testacea]